MEAESRLKEMYIRGIQVNYYYICKTKLWLFSHGITMEKESDLVKLGSLLHRETFLRDEKDVMIEPIAIDVVRGKNGEITVVEVKRSERMEKAHIFQVAYYLYFLEKLGIKAKGQISYPKKKKVVDVILDEKMREEVEKALREIEETVRGEIPKPVYRSFCRKCAYYELCFC